MKKVIQELLVLLVAWAIGTVLLILVHLIPQNWMDTNLETTTLIFKEAGGGSALLPFADETRLNYFSDAVMINVSYTERGTLIEKSLLSQMYNIDSPSAGLGQYYYSGDKDAMNLFCYARYWHGYQVLLRPLMVIFNITQIRMLGMCLLIALTLLIICRLIRIKKNVLIFPFYAMIIFLVPATTLITLSHFSIVGIVLLTILALTFDEFREKYAGLLFQISGILTAYLDLLTYPLISLGLPLLFYFSLSNYFNQKSPLKELFRQFIVLCLFWCVGYIGMWAGKWIMTQLLTNFNAIQDAMDTVLQRSGTLVGEKTLSYRDVLNRNISCYNTAVYKLMLILLIAVVIIYLMRGWHLSFSGTQAIEIIIITFPFIWYRLTMNHSYIHWFFTCRVTSIALTAMVMLPFSALIQGPYNEER